MTIAEELRQLSDAASFTIADMASWCGYGRSAMRQWMIGDHAPHPVREKYLRERMQLLAKAIDKFDTLPIPSTIKSYDRPQYVQQVRDHALKEFSKANFTRTGRQSLDQHQ